MVTWWKLRWEFNNRIMYYRGKLMAAPKYWNTIEKWQRFHRMVDVGRCVWRSSGPTPAQTGLPKAGCVRPCPGDIWIYQRRDTPQPHWATCADGRAGGIKEGPHTNEALLLLVILAKQNSTSGKEIVTGVLLTKSPLVTDLHWKVEGKDFKGTS